MCFRLQRDKIERVREINENIQAVASRPEQAVSMSPDGLIDHTAPEDKPVTAKESSSLWNKKSARKLLMVALAVGVVVAGVAFGLPPVFSTKKEPKDVPEQIREEPPQDAP